MKTKTVKIVCTLAVCVLVAGTVSARPHHHHGSKDLHRAAAIVDIVTNSLVGLSILSGNTPVVTTPVVTTPVVTTPVVTPAPVYVAPTPVYVAPPPPPRPIYVAPPRRYYRPAPPPRHHRAPAHRGGGHKGGRR